MHWVYTFKICTENKTSQSEIALKEYIEVAYGYSTLYKTVRHRKMPTHRGVHTGTPLCFVTALAEPRACAVPVEISSDPSKFPPSLSLSAPTSFLRCRLSCMGFSQCAHVAPPLVAKRFPTGTPWPCAGTACGLTQAYPLVHPRSILNLPLCGVQCRGGAGAVPRFPCERLSKGRDIFLCAYITAAFGHQIH